MSSRSRHGVVGASQAIKAELDLAETNGAVHQPLADGGAETFVELDQLLDQQVARGKSILQEADRWDSAIGHAESAGFKQPEVAVESALRSAVTHSVEHGLPLNPDKLADSIEGYLDRAAAHNGKKPAGYAL